MIRLTLAEVARATGGTLHGDPDAVVHASVVVDSRLVEAGSLFVALAGERTDGHDHAAGAVAAGATGVLAERALDGLPCVVVDDGVAALGQLARAVLDRLPDVVVVGVTGSSGKTSTKDLMAQVLVEQGPTVWPPGSFNNDIGLPLTVLRADEGTRFLVLEYSARGVGHIARLCEVAPPRVAAVLNVGAAHAGEFGSLQATATAKGELVEALPADGVAVLSADDDLVRAMAPRTSARVLLAGFADDADVRAADVVLDAGRPRFTLVTADDAAPVALRLVGRHAAANATAAAAVCLAVGVPLDRVGDALSRATPASRWRMELDDTPAGVTVVNDAYNANPDSVRAALEAVTALAGDRPRWAVLGPMGELGDGAAQAHTEAGREAARLGFEHLVAVGAAGSDVEHLVAGSGGMDAVRVDDVAAALALLTERLAPGDVVLVKASRSAGLERVAAGLLADGPQGSPAPADDTPGGGSRAARTAPGETDGRPGRAPGPHSGGTHR